MDKKQLAALIESIVTRVAETHGLEESEARVYVGVAIRKSADAFVNSISVPSFVKQETPAV